MVRDLVWLARDFGQFMGWPDRPVFGDIQELDCRGFACTYCKSLFEIRLSSLLFQLEHRRAIQQWDRTIPEVFFRDEFHHIREAED
jgi:hypothetical protein